MVSKGSIFSLSFEGGISIASGSFDRVAILLPPFRNGDTIAKLSQDTKEIFPSLNFRQKEK